MAAFLTMVMLAAMMAAVPAPPVALADDICAVTPGCGDGTASSSLYVDHRTVSLNTPVEPDDGEVIEVKAYWYTGLSGTPACSCTLGNTSSVTVEVTWNQSTGSWSASCTGCNSTKRVGRNVER
jgi:hypothetical protein